jgi:hypothetical protein
MKGHIRKRGNKYAVVIDIGQKEDGSRNRKWFSGFDKQKEAQKFLNEKLHEIETGKFIEPAKETFGEYLSGWLEDKKSQVRPSTWKSYRWLVNRVIKHLLMFFLVYKRQLLNSLQTPFLGVKIMLKNHFSTQGSNSVAIYQKTNRVGGGD